MTKRLGFFGAVFLASALGTPIAPADLMGRVFSSDLDTAGPAFEVDDIIVSDPTDSLVDPEFDKNLASLRMAWQDRTGELWVAEVDPRTGTWSPPDGRQTLVDSGGFTISDTRQGPEWAYDDKGNRIVYTREENGKPVLFQARQDLKTGDYRAERVADGESLSLAKASEDPQDPRPRITVSYADGANGVFRGWREIDDATTQTLLPADAVKIRWITGLRALVGIREIRGIDQVFSYSLDAGGVTQLTFDRTPKSFPVMWPDPATGRYLLAASIADRHIGIWIRLRPGKWTFVKSLRPPTNIPYVYQLEPFIWKGASYLSYLMHTERSGKRQNFTGTGEVWVTRVSGTGPFRHRQVNDPLVTRIKDPENLPVEDTVYIYYAEILDSQNYRRLIHRAATGL